MSKKRNLVIGLLVASVVISVTIGVVIITQSKKSEDTPSITSAQIIPCRDESCRDTVSINMTLAKKSPNAIVTPRRDNVQLAATTGYTIVDTDLPAGQTYQYSISYGDSNVWSPVMSVAVEQYATLCQSLGQDNFNGTCVPSCKPDSTRNATGLCVCKDANSTQDATGTCVCNAGYDSFAGSCVPSCKSDSTRNTATGLCVCNDVNSTRNAEGNCVCNAGYELVNGLCAPVCGTNFERNSAGVCVCKPGYLGTLCNYSDAITCNGHGTAQSNGTCICAPGYANPDCKTCATGYTGDNCQYSDTITCNGRGAAQSNGTCICAPGYASPDCKTCAAGFLGTSCQFSNATTCNNNGSVDASGVCTCNAGYAGTSCQDCATGYTLNTTNKQCEPALSIKSSQITACTDPTCANTVDITLEIAGPNNTPFKIRRNNEVILTGVVGGEFVPVNCLTSTAPFGNVNWTIFRSNFLRTFRSEPYVFTLTMGSVVGGYQWYSSNVTKLSGGVAKPVVELGLLKVVGGVNLKFRGLYSDAYGNDNSTSLETYHEMFSSDTAPLSVGSLPPVTISYTIGTGTVANSPVANKNGVVDFTTTGIYDTRSALTALWFDSVQRYQVTQTISLPSISVGIQQITNDQVRIHLIMYAYQVPYLSSSSETVLVYPENIIPMRSGVYVYTYTPDITVSNNIVSVPALNKVAMRANNVTTATAYNFTISGFNIPLTLPPPSPYTYVNPMPVFINTVDTTNSTGCFDLMTIDLTNYVRGGQGVSVPTVKLNRESVTASTLKRYACTGTGTCALTSSSDTLTTYATAGECRCNSCTAGVCSTVSANTKGTLASCVGASCALQLMGNDTTARNFGTFATLRDTRFAGVSTTTGLPYDYTIYPARVIVPQNPVLTPEGYVLTWTAAAEYGDVKFVGASPTTPLFKYYPLFIFTASKRYVTLSSGGAQIRFTDSATATTGTHRADVQVVLVPWGNKTANLPDPPIFPGTVSRTMVVSGVTTTYTVPKVTEVLGTAASAAVATTRGVLSTVAPGFDATKLSVSPGFQYAIAMQATIATNQFVYMAWQAFSTTTPAVIFSDV